MQSAGEVEELSFVSGCRWLAGLLPCVCLVTDGSAAAAAAAACVQIRRITYEYLSVAQEITGRDRGENAPDLRVAQTPVAGQVSLEVSCSKKIRLRLGGFTFRWI